MLDVNFFDELRIGLATADDIRRFIDRRLKATRRRWLRNIREVVVNDAVAKLFADSPTSSGADVGNLLNVELIEAADVSNAIAWLVSDQARYVTGIALPVDAGFTAK